MAFICLKINCNLIKLKTKSVRSNSIKNIDSARVSIIGQLKKLTTSNKGINQENCTENINPPHLGSQSYEVMQTNLIEENEEITDDQEPDKKDSKIDSTSSSSSLQLEEFKQPEVKIYLYTKNFIIFMFILNIYIIKKTVDKYVWRIDLTKTEKYWKDWFKGLSGMFLNVNVPKLLLLAGVDRLDRELMVGQMQGKFQMQVLPQCGHAVHEDSPNEVANALSNFVIRNKITESILSDEQKLSLPRLDSC